MALLGPAWLGSFAITSVYLGYQQQAANTPCSEQEASHSLDWTQPVWAGVVVVFLVVSVIRTARAGRGISARKVGA